MPVAPAYARLRSLSHHKPADLLYVRYRRTDRCKHKIKELALELLSLGRCIGEHKVNVYFCRCGAETQHRRRERAQAAVPRATRPLTSRPREKQAQDKARWGAGKINRALDSPDSANQRIDNGTDGDALRVLYAYRCCTANLNILTPKSLPSGADMLCRHRKFIILLLHIMMSQ